MKVVYHRLAALDVREILYHYAAEVGRHLADRFFAEFLALIERMRASPRRFPPMGDSGLRRANLPNFPYHILYEERLWGIKVMVVRHHRRSPRYGLRRR